MVDKKIRTVYFYKSYFIDFINSLRNPKAKEKTLYILRIIETVERVSTDYLKHVEGTDGLYEIRIKSSSDIYRVFCFFDAGRLIIVVNGFQKKSQKTPKGEIERALRIKAEYEREMRDINEISKKKK